MFTGIDTFGHGRCPYFMEASNIIVITDGSRLTNTSNVHNEFVIPRVPYTLGSEFCIEPFRWDQKLYSIVLRMSGSYNMENQMNGLPAEVAPCDNSSLNDLCETTGGE